MANHSAKLNPLLAVFITVFIDMLGVSIIIPVFAPLIVQNTHGMLPAEMSEATRNLIYGLLTATFPFFQFFGAPILGTLADKHGRKKILQISIIGTFVGYVLFALSINSHALWLLFLARAIPGFMGGNISIVMAALADISKPEERAKNFGMIGMAFGLGFILGPAIGGVLASSDVVSFFDYSTPLWFTALLTLINFYYVQKQFPETYKPNGNASKISLLAGVNNIRKALRMVNMRVILITVFFQSFGFSFFMQFNQVYLIKKFAFNEKQIGLLFAYIGLWIAFTQGVIVRNVTKKFIPPQILRISLLGLAVTIFVILLPQQAWMLLLVNPFVAIFQGLTQPNQTSIVSNMTPRDMQGEMLGIQQSVASLAFTIPPLIAGVIVTFDYRLPIIVSAVMILLAWINFYFRFKGNEAVFKQQAATA
ncbi:MAG: MFS transporter [Chitinophagales bacterium]|nr:MFS transporter [Chitinophagales bacterium]